MNPVTYCKTSSPLKIAVLLYCTFHLLLAVIRFGVILFLGYAHVLCYPEVGYPVPDHPFGSLCKSARLDPCFRHYSVDLIDETYGFILCAIKDSGYDLENIT